jgi:hypothetical protein
MPFPDFPLGSLHLNCSETNIFHAHKSCSKRDFSLTNHNLRVAVSTMIVTTHALR